MKGLLFKNVCQMWTKGKGNLIMAAGLLCVGAVTGNKGSFWVLYSAMVMVGMMPMALFAYEESSGWQSYVKTLPVSREQIVGEKYLFGLLLAAVELLLAAAALCLAPLFGNAWTLNGAAALLMQVLAAGLAVNIFILPLCFRFGVENARWIFSVLIGLFFGVGCALLIQENSSGLERGGRVLNELVGAMNAAPAVGLAVALAAMAALYALSWRLSVAWYDKKRD